MAEMQADHGAMAPELGKSMTTAANWLGAAISLALVIGIGLWGYRIVVRDVSGVPVVRAADGPMRIQPDNPGGRPAEHQGLAVNSVAGQGSAEDPADKLILAPQPVSLTEEDQPLSRLITMSEPDKLPAVPQEAPASADVAASGAEEEIS